MNPIITANDTTIEIKIIDEKGCYYKTNIPNNDINKKLIENTVFKFEKSGTQTIIMHDDNNVFQLNKIECKYSEFIEIKKQLEDTQKEVILLKQELSKNKLLQQIKNDMVNIKNKLFNTNNNLQQQLNITSYYLPIVFISRYSESFQYYGDEQCTNNIQHFLNGRQIKLINGTKLFIAYENQCLRSSCPGNRYNYKIFIPPKKTVMLFKPPIIEIYCSGIHSNIEGCQFFWCGKEEDKDELINTLKNIDYNCDNIIKY